MAPEWLASAARLGETGAARPSRAHHRTAQRQEAPAASGCRPPNSTFVVAFEATLPLSQAVREPPPPSALQFTT